jgi:hypothetical protein
MMRRTVIGLVLVSWLAIACFEEGGTRPLVFPNEGRSGSTGAHGGRGSTAAIMIDSNYMPLNDLDEWHDLTPDRVQVWVVDKSTTPPVFQAEAQVRAVFELSPDRWSELAISQHGLLGVVALFDLPSHQDLGSPTYPLDVWVEVRTVDPEAATPVYTERKSSFTLTGTDGIPQPLMANAVWPGQEQYWLERRRQPVVRLRAKRGDFEAGQVIGSVEFEFHYNGCVASIAAAKEATEATGVVMVGPKISDSQKVVLVSPNGFQLTFYEPPLFAYDPELAGEGPFLDLLIEESASPCDLTNPNWFSIHNLRVTDIDGVELFSEATVGFDTPTAPAPNTTLRAYLIDPTG